MRAREASQIPTYGKPRPRPAFENVGWLNAAEGNLEVLKVLIAAGASKNDQSDKDLALLEAARSGNVAAVRALIAYGANPNADLSKLIITDSLPPFIGTKQGSGSLLIYAARSGNPEMVREILQYRPKLEKRDSDGRTAIFAAGESEGEAEESARVECIRLLVKAGAKVRVRDNDGNTPLHETYIPEVIEELLKLGADVNARNKEGETPIFTTVDYLAIPLFIKYGADLSIRNKEGKTVMESGEPLRLQAIQRAMQSSKKK